MAYKLSKSAEERESAIGIYMSYQAISLMAIFDLLHKRIHYIINEIGLYTSTNHK
jgi:hypothetical protein